MGRIPSLIAYPIFRLTVSMAVGIFLFDQFLTEGAGDWLLLGQGGLALMLGQGGLALMLGLMAWMHRKGIYHWRGIFGGLTALFFLLLGGLRLLQEEQRVGYEWPEEECVYQGEVLTPPVTKGKSRQAEVRVLTAQPATPVDRTILLYWIPDTLRREVVCGDHLLFSTRITQPLSDEEITGFDYAGYLHRKGISGTAIAYSDSWKFTDQRTTLGLKQWALWCRNKVVERYRQWQLGADEFAVVAALTIGDKSVLPDSLKEIYSAAGVSHVLALSGLHIGILSALLYFFLAPLRRWRYGDKLRSLLVIAALWSFAFISGLSPSVVRAVTMCTLYFLATCVMEEAFSGSYALALTAFLMLLYQPFYLFDASFQLSFLAVGSILYFYPLIAGSLVVKTRLLRWLWNGLSVSVSAQLGTLPLILYYFGTFPTYFLLANLLVSVLAVCVLGGAIAALSLSELPVVGSLAVAFLNTVTALLNQSIEWVQSLSGSQIDSLSITPLQSACGFLFLYGLYQYLTHKQSGYLVCLLVALNVTLAEWALQPLQPTRSALYFNRSQLYLKHRQTVTPLTSANGLYTIDTLRVGLIGNDQWRHKAATPPIPLHYLCLTRGFKGNLTTLVRVFQIRHLILDSSLSANYRKILKQQSEELKIPYTDLSEKGSFRILL